MPLLIPFDPTGLDARTVDALDDLIAAIQTWAGKQDADGRWVTPVHDPANFQIDGAGNSWTVMERAVGAGINPLSYTIIGTTMILNLNVLNSTVVATATAVTSVKIRLPDGYQIAGGTADYRLYEGTGRMLNGAALHTMRIYNSNNPYYVRCERHLGTVLANGTLNVQGQIALDVTKG